MLRKVLFASVLSILISFPSYAVDVTNGNQEGTGSLYEAILQANRGTDTTINIRHSDVSTITLHRELTIEKNVTINGNGVTIEGTNDRRLFRITGGHAVFNAITFTKGNASSGNGGAVEIAGGTWAEFNNCTFFGNSARDYGGAVCVTEGSQVNATVLNQCSVSGNTASINGGGVATCGGDLRLCSSIITGNTSDSDIYASSEGDVKSFYNIIGTSSITGENDITGQTAGDIFTLDSEGKPYLRTISGVQVLELSATSKARDAIPANTGYTLDTDAIGTTRPQFKAYDTGAYEIKAVPVESFDLYGMPYIQINTSGTVSIDIFPENASLNAEDYPPRGIEWTSSNPSVLTVDSDGKITPVSVGETGLAQSSITAVVHGWDANGNPVQKTGRAFTVYVGEESASAIKAAIDPLENMTLSAGEHRLVKPSVKLDVSGVELTNIRAGVNYILTASSSRTDIVDTEIVSNDSVRLLAGSTAGSADIEITARPEPAASSQAMTRAFIVTVTASAAQPEETEKPAESPDATVSGDVNTIEENDVGHGGGGGCNSGALGIVFVLALSALIHKRG